MLDPVTLLRPKRTITGASAVLLPFTDAGAIDWETFVLLVGRTAAEGLIPAVNMDTGYVNLIAPADRALVLERTREVMEGRRWFAGAFVADEPGAAFAARDYLAAVDQISAASGTPVIFQSFGLTEQPADALIASYERIGDAVDAFVAFELGTMFAPFGAIYDLDTYEGLLGIPACIGAKHSSLDRMQEWERIVLRDRVRPAFHVFTGNDLAIDMVMYGSDYLLGLSAFAPDVFARRDAMWAAGDPGFHGLNDDLQYLGQLAFRAPVPAYKHAAAMFLATCKRIPSDEPHPQGARRPDSDRPLLDDIAARLGLLGAGW
jgi:dihydrodipicolinate synthase/N-acetylneuraminate lyase